MDQVIRLIFPYAATTHGVTVRVAPRYLPDQSDPRAPRHVWSYHVRIENGGDAAVQLRSRHWRITDALGRSESIEGPGVIGQQPVIEPGMAFDYVSGVPLATASGSMHGSYHMTGTRGGFDVDIPAFRLELPAAGPGVS
jgi:ApaG protein